MLLDKALVRSVVIRAVTADVAKSKVGDASLNAGRPGDNFTVIRAYRFYKKLTAEPIRKTYIAIDKLLSVKKAIEVMTEIENRKFPIVIRPEDLPYTNPNHVCTEECYTVEVGLHSDPLPDLPASNYCGSGEYSADSIEVLKGMDKACRWHGAKYVDATGRCTALDSGSEYLTQFVYGERKVPVAIVVASEAAAQAFRNEGTAAEAVADALAPIQDLPAASVTIEREGQPTQTSSGAAEGWADSFDLDEAAPIVHPPSPCSDEYSEPLPRLVLEEGRGLPSELTLTVHPKKSSVVPVLLTTLGVIGALVYVYFHYFAR